MVTSTLPISNQVGSNISRRPSSHRHRYSQPMYDDSWFKEFYESLPNPPTGNKRPKEAYLDAYRFGWLYSQRSKLPYEQAEVELETIWNDLIGPVQMEWNEIQPVVQHAYVINRAAAI